MTKMATNL